VPVNDMDAFIRCISSQSGPDPKTVLPSGMFLEDFSPSLELKFLKYLTKEALNRVVNWARFNGATVLHVLLLLDKNGMDFFCQYFGAFKDQLTVAGMWQRIKGGEFDGQSVLTALAIHPKGIKLLIEHFDFLKGSGLVNVERLTSPMPYLKSGTPSTAVLFTEMTCYREGGGWFTAQWNYLEKNSLLTPEVLYPNFRVEGKIEGPLFNVLALGDPDTGHFILKKLPFFIRQGWFKRSDTYPTPPGCAIIATIVSSIAGRQWIAESVQGNRRIIEVLFARDMASILEKRPDFLHNLMAADLSFVIEYWDLLVANQFITPSSLCYKGVDSKRSAFDLLLNQARGIELLQAKWPWFVQHGVMSTFIEREPEGPIKSLLRFPVTVTDDFPCIDTHWEILRDLGIISKEHIMRGMSWLVSSHSNLLCGRWECFQEMGVLTPECMHQLIDLNINGDPGQVRISVLDCLIITESGRELIRTHWPHFLKSGIITSDLLNEALPPYEEILPEREIVESETSRTRGEQLGLTPEKLIVIEALIKKYAQEIQAQVPAIVNTSYGFFPDAPTPPRREGYPTPGAGT